MIKGDPGLGQALRGELGKFALTISLFALVFVFVKPLNILVFFGNICRIAGLYGCRPFAWLSQAAKEMIKVSVSMT